MPATAGETFYDLGVRALAEQESQVASLRTRAGTLVAGAAVVATLLVKPVFAQSHPDGFVEWGTTGLGLSGLAMLLTAAVYLLRSHDFTFALDVGAVYGEAEQRGDLDDGADVGALQLDLATTMSEQHGANNPTLVSMRGAMSMALAGLIAEAVGLGLAAGLA